MSITASNTANIAHLARLCFNDDALALLAQRMTDVLALAEQLQSVNTDDVEPMAHPYDIEQPLREDAVTETDQSDTHLALAPATEAHLYLVPVVQATE